MKFRIIIFATLTLILSGLTTLTVHAESGKYYYYEKWNTYERETYSNYRLAYYHCPETNFYTLYYGAGQGVTENYTPDSETRVKVSGVVQAHNDYYAYPYPHALNYDHSRALPGDYESTIPVFETIEDLNAYMEIGMTISSFHDFTADTYSKDIPVPELKSINHNGFTLVNNPENKYYVDIIQSTILYGVKVKNNGIMSYYPVLDEDWIYSFRYYNYADTREPTHAIQVNIPLIYGVDAEKNLIDDFKNWSEDYPTYSSLPSYSWYMSGSGATTNYNTSHKYSSNSNLTDSEQLQQSGQAQSTYFVRYRDDAGNCGAWVKYVFKDGTKKGGGFIKVEMPQYNEFGNLVTDDNGNIVYDATLTGSQDYGTGLTKYGDTTGYDKWWEVFKDWKEIGDIDPGNVGDIGGWSLYDVFGGIGKIFSGMESSIGSFSSLVSACFSFLPKEVVSMIISSIVIMIFIGIIKAVI